MAYTIDRYNRTVLTVVEDGTIDQSTDLKLVGKNYAGYGEIQNENFVYLLENFAGGTAPSKPISGQVWFDSGSSKLKFYDGSKWRTTGGAEVLSSTPSGLTEGDFWWDTANEQLYAYNGTDFVLVGPQDAGDGITQMKSRTVRDIGGTAHAVITSIVNDTVVSIISNDAFSIDNTDAENSIPGFDVVKQGITMVNTLAAGNGVTSSAHQYWGTASAAKGLVVGGALVTADQFVQAGEATFNTLVEFADIGLAVGDSNDLRIFIQNDNEAVISNQVGQKITFKAKNVSGTIINPMIVTANAILPGLQSDNTTTETVTLGNVTRVFDNVYSNNFTGLSEKASSLVVGGNKRYGDTTAVVNTVAVRDASGDLRANLFRGIATQAKYADLAEKYTADRLLAPGTVVSVCEHGEHEVELAPAGGIAIGVVSTDPAVMMNSEADGQYIGLKGRLPVRVVGPVKKGQAVYVHGEGVACASHTGACIVGVALESNDSAEEKLVECVLKV